MLGFDDHWLLTRFLFLIPIVLSLSVHEWAHAFSALMLGDDTAARMGRVTLNPLEHIDPVGSLILPLLGVPFGWAKPVPINPGRFRRDVGLRSGLFLTAAAGPASNLCLAIAAVVLLGACARFAPHAVYGPQGLLPLFQWIVVLNVLLACFNLLPVPPLDGSRILDAWIPDALRPAWDRLATHSHFALLAVILLPLLAGVNLFEGPMHWAGQLCQSVLH